MAEHRPVAAMDPPHITEFASERYFEKLSQLNASQQPQQPAEASEASSAAVAASPSTFILPLRETKIAEVDAAAKPAEQKREKSRFFSIRHKVSLLHSKSHAVDVLPVPAALPHQRSSAESTRKRFVPLSSVSRPFALLTGLSAQPPVRPAVPCAAK